jgi:hypothetical protein
MVEIGYLRCLSQEKMKNILGETISSQQEIGKVVEVAVVAGDLSPVDDLPVGDSSPVVDLPVGLSGTQEAISPNPPGTAVVEINDGMVSTYYDID